MNVFSLASYPYLFVIDQNSLFAAYWRWSSTFRPLAYSIQPITSNRVVSIIRTGCIRRKHCLLPGPYTPRSMLWINSLDDLTRLHLWSPSPGSKVSFPSMVATTATPIPRRKPLSFRGMAIFCTPVGLSAQSLNPRKDIPPLLLTI